MEVTNYLAQEAKAREIFHDMPADAVIDVETTNYAGQDYTLGSDALKLHDTPTEVKVIDVPATSLPEVAGVDPADFEVTTTYGIFNDPTFWEPLFTSGNQPEALRETLLTVPIYEDESPSRTLAHARLMNSDREREGKLRTIGPVIVKRRVTLQSPWLTDVDS